MPAPLANRFSHFELDVNLDDWVAWAYAHGIDQCLIAFLRFRPELWFDFDPARNPVAFPTPRSWEFADRALRKFGENPDLLRVALEACVGPAAGIEHARQVYGHIIDYAARFPEREMGVMLVSDMHRAIGRELFAVPWGQRIQLN